MDALNNEIGEAIGRAVRASGGTAADVLEWSQKVMENSFPADSHGETEWERIEGTDLFTARGATSTTLPDGTVVGPVVVADPSTWQLHPEGLEIDESNWPSTDWTDRYSNDGEQRIENYMNGRGGTITIEEGEEPWSEDFGLAPTDQSVLPRGGSARLNGGDGDDILRGGAGSDVLVGGAGRDVLVGGAGRDVMHGGAGHDVVYADAEDVFFANGVAQITGGAGYDRLILTADTAFTNVDIDSLGFEAVDLSDSANVITGNKSDVNYYLDGKGGNDSLTSAGGDDVLIGGVGNDTLTGNAGNDRLFGEDGNDQIDGGDGNDVIAGGKGRDTLTGGAGDDIYFYLRGDGSDTILDQAFGTYEERNNYYENMLHQSGKNARYVNELRTGYRSVTGERTAVSTRFSLAKVSISKT